MATTFTPQQLAAQAAKRAATRAQNQAAGTSVRAQRAAKKAAKAAAAAAAAGQTYTPPPPPPSNPWGARARRRRSRRFSSATPPPPQTPVFATPKPNYRALKLAALVALEQAFTQKLAEQGITDDVRTAYGTYRKLKALALGATSSTAAQTEADAALRMATVHLVKLAF